MIFGADQEVANVRFSRDGCTSGVLVEINGLRINPACLAYICISHFSVEYSYPRAEAPIGATLKYATVSVASENELDSRSIAGRIVHRGNVEARLLIVAHSYPSVGYVLLSKWGIIRVSRLVILSISVDAYW
jgi:hypothetical protein